jgi:hypothetical protein
MHFFFFIALYQKTDECGNHRIHPFFDILIHSEEFKLYGATRIL